MVCCNQNYSHVLKILKASREAFSVNFAVLVSLSHATHKTSLAQISTVIIYLGQVESSVQTAQAEFVPDGKGMTILVESIKMLKLGTN